MRLLNWNIAIALWVSAVGSGCCRQLEEKGASDKRVVAEDYQVIEAVLSHLASDTELAEMQQLDDAKTAVVVQAATPGGSGFLSDEQLDGEGYNQATRLLTRELRDDLRRRNQGPSIALSDLHAEDNKTIVVKDVNDWTDQDRFSAQFPPARVYVEPWLPGYSDDRRTAVLRVWLGPTAHGATATYLLSKQGGAWSVRWRKVSYYG